GSAGGSGGKEWNRTHTTRRRALVGCSAELASRRPNAATTSLAAQKPDHSLPHLAFRIARHKWLETQLQIQRYRRQPIGLRMKTSFLTSRLPRQRKHTDNQRPRQALPTPIPIPPNPTHPTTLRKLRTHLERSRRNPPHL